MQLKVLCTKPIIGVVPDGDEGGEGGNIIQGDFRNDRIISCTGNNFGGRSRYRVYIVIYNCGSMGYGKQKQLRKHCSLYLRVTTSYII